MFSWLTIPGFVENVTDFLLDVTTSQKAVDASLEEARSALQSTELLVETHSTLLAPEEYAMLIAKHRSYHLNLMEERQLSSTPNRRSRRARVATLHKTIHAFRSEAQLLAQRAANQMGSASPFDDEPPESTEPPYT
ncbi:hypothetical protein FRC07_000087 [Ceratobasidium sp. 392]|nr:hypothetical protein FRC07_000087 [Ceratobasidium sp. 392]